MRHIFLLLFTLNALCGFAQAKQDSVYMFTSFHEPADEGLRMLYSEDGLHWDSIPGIFLTPQVGQQRVMRDPSIQQSADGTFHFVWTSSWRGDRGFGYSSSKDLVHWTTPRFIEVMTDTSTVNVWAPELFWDDVRQEMMVVWASCIPGKFPDGMEEHKNNHRQYYTCTKDFQTFTPARLLLDPGYSSIDAQIIKRGKDDYVMVIKDNTRPNRNVKVSFAKDPHGPWSATMTPFTPGFCEGPNVAHLKDGSYVVYCDRYRQRDFGAYQTTDFEVFRDITPKTSIPVGHKHGTIFRISRKQLDYILSQHPAINHDAENDFSHKYTRTFSAIMKSIEKEFGVKFKYNVDTVGLKLPYADFRVRHYSLEQTLDNVCKYFDFNWWNQGKKTYKIKPYEYPRRHDEEGQKMLDWLSAKYSDVKAWEARRDALRKEVRQRLQIDTYLDSCVKGAKAVLSKVRKYDGYTVQNLCIETLPGEHIYASIYTPAKIAKHGNPLIICPNGHFGDGRYRKDQQQRMGTLARMGAICVDFDLYAWGQSADEYPSHQTDRAHVIQAMNGVVLLDWMLANRGKQVDRSRIATNGGSGGGSYAVLLACIDSRFTAAAPTVNLASHFDGGCPCESGKPIHMSLGGTCNPELLACVAPNPVQVVSDSGDWTHSVPTIELPFLKRIWGFYGKEENVSNVHLDGERHDYGPNKRNANYDFFIKVFNLDASKRDESKITIEDYEMLKSK